MSPYLFHEYLLNCNCEFQNLTKDFLHAVYKNPKNGKRYTILKECEAILPETIEVCCWFLEIPLPLNSGYSLTDFNAIKAKNKKKQESEQEEE